MISTPLQKPVPEARWLSGPEVWTVYNSCDIFYESEVVVCIETRNGIASVKNQRSSLCTGSMAKFPATGSSGSASDDG